MDHAGKRVLVTGAAGGAGSAIAKAFAGAGATVVVTDLTEEALRPVAEAIRSAGGEVEVQPGDLSTRASCRELAGRCGEIDILLNVAALTFMRFQDVTVPDDDFWDRTFAIDFFAPVTLIQALAPGMEKRGKGVIINISSVAAVRGTPSLAPYSAAKAALEAMTKVAAMEFGAKGTGVRVNSVAFGLVETPALRRGFTDEETMHEEARRSVPLGRLIRPEEVADFCVYLASDRASAVLGTTVLIDGGFTSGAYNHLGAYISSD